MEEPHQGWVSALRDLFDALTDSELRGLIEELDVEAIRDLPGSSASPNVLAQCAVGVVERRRILRAGPLERLGRRRPDLADRVAVLASAAGITLRLDSSDVPLVRRSGRAVVLAGVLVALAAVVAIWRFGAGVAEAPASVGRGSGDVPASRAATVARVEPREGGDEPSIEPAAPPDPPVAADAPVEIRKKVLESPRRLERPVEPPATKVSPAFESRRWTVARVGSLHGDDGKRIELAGPALPAAGVLRLRPPTDERVLVDHVDCRIERGPSPRCMLVVIPGNPGLRVGDVLELRPEPE